MTIELQHDLLHAARVHATNSHQRTDLHMLSEILSIYSTMLYLASATITAVTSPYGLRWKNLRQYWGGPANTHLCQSKSLHAPFDPGL